MVKMSRIVTLSTLVLLVFCCTPQLQAQRKKSNWLQDKKDHTGRWRVGLGLDVLEPTGIDVQFYRLSKVCTSDFSITKKMAIGTWVGTEGLLLGGVIDSQNKVEWKNGSLRYGLDLKFYIPIILNPYIGIGAEGGNRSLDGEQKFQPDVIGRIGLEQMILGIKLSTSSSLNITLFVDAKINKSINTDFMYIMPSGGIRFHWL
ncbi:MAG TPA: hypothetical protein PK784_00535 [Tenuifilaceae bacterium]|nr:hypothetical protein [Tenuifilaceae bacterium]HPV57594.1 hypothetical protein [Tenuifilaceae bacterium]